MTITGTVGSDTLVGGDAHDVFQGLAGDDSLVGGNGVDTALFSGTKAGHRVTALGAGRWSVADLDPSDGDDGTDLLAGVEKLRFADGDLQLDDTGEFQVNTWVRDHQADPSLAALADGGWVVAWTSYGQDGDRAGAYAQRFADDGQRLGDEFRLNETTEGTQPDVAIAALAGGGFVAVWSSGVPGESMRLTGRLFDAVGAPRGGEFALDENFLGYQASPAVLARPDGGFAVAWKATIYGLSHVALRTFAADGSPTSDVVPADEQSPPPEPILYRPELAALPGGGFAVAWLSDPADGLGNRLLVRTFAADASATGPETVVGDRSRGAQDTPAIAALAGGGLVAAWTVGGDLSTGAGRGILAQRLNADGTAAGPVFQVSADPVDPFYDWYLDPAIAALPGGGFVVAWLGPSEAPNDSIDVFARRYSADGTAAGTPFLVNTVSYGQQWTPATAALDDGGFVIAWRSDGVDSPLYGPDPWGTGGVFAQRYNAAGEPMPANLPTGEVGTGIADLLVGTPGADSLRGFAGDDTLQGGPGDDTVDGGDGTDTARYAGPMGDFSFSNTVAYRFGLEDGVAANGDEGRDTLTAVERIAFADGALDVAQRSEFVLAAGGTLANRPGARDASMARLADGRLVAAWTAADVSDEGVYAQLLAADATPLAPVFRVNATSWQSQTAPSVAALPDGGFLVAWDSEQDGSESGIYLQRYAASGAPVGTETRVNTYTRSDQLAPQLAVQPSGAFLVVWHSLEQDGSGYGVYAQRMAADGTALGGEFRVNETTAGGQMLASVTVLTDGSYFVAWMSAIPNLPDFDADIHARRYAADGTALGGEFRVNAYTTLDQGFPSVAALPGGGCVVVWHSQGQDGDGYGVYGQRFAADGTRVGDEFRVNSTTAEPQSVPTVAALAGGGFVVVWSSGYYWSGAGREEDRDLFGQRFAADGTPVGDEFRVNTLDDYDQEFVEILPAPDGGFLVAWNSEVVVTETSPGVQTVQNAVMAKRFDADGREVNELTVTGGTGADTLRGGEGTQILVGGGGDDVYEADLVRDRIVELAGEGRDTLRSTASAALPAEIEDLELTGTADVDGSGNAAANRLAGNEGANRLWGLGGDDELLGGPGADTLAGGAGDDNLGGGGGRDVFEFAAAGDGVDTIADFGDGDRIRIGSASLAGPVTVGSGEALGAGRVQVAASAGQSTVSIGLDTAPGADLVVRLAGSFGPTDLYAEGETIRFNNAPTLAGPIAPLQCAEGSPLSWQPPPGAFVDADAWAGDRVALTATLAGGLALPAWLASDPVAGTLSGTPGNDDTGLWRVEVAGTDLALANVRGVLELLVVDVNSAPRLVSPLPDLTATAGLPLQFTPTSLQVDDADRGDRLAWSFSLASGDPLPGWLSWDAASRTLLGTPAAGDAGTLSIRATATDLGQASVQDVFEIVVSPWTLAAPGGDALNAAALSRALDGVLPAPEAAGRWLAAFAAGNGAERVAEQMLADATPPIADADLVDRLFSNVLGRPPAPDESAGLLAGLDAGALTRAGLLSLAATLPEHLAAVERELGDGLRWTPWTGQSLSFDAQGPAAVAFGLARALNGEAPSPADLGRWMATLAHGDEAETARQMIAADAPAIGHAQFVERVFSNVVGRAPTPAEAAPLQALLDGDALTQGALLALAARTPPIQAAIAGAFADGLPFVRWDGPVLTRDLDGAPGLVYALLFAVLDAPPAPEVIGRWIAFADGLAGAQAEPGAGLDAAAKAQLAAAVLSHYAPDLSNQSLVAMLYANLFGLPSDRAVEAQFQAVLDAGATTQAGVLLLAAESPLNLDQYVGLVAQGITYHPWLVG